jgi:hypothetical protein
MRGVLPPDPRPWELLAGGLVAYADGFRRTTVDRIDGILFLSTDGADPRFVANMTATLGSASIATAMLTLGRRRPI